MADKKPKVDAATCIACGLCVNQVPEVFEFNAEGKSVVKKLDDYTKHMDSVDQAIAACPVQAISWE